MQFNKTLSFLTLIFAVCGCSTISGAQKNSMLDFQKVQSINLGTTQNVVQDLLGHPSQVLQISSPENEVVWLYQAGKYNATRASFVFNTTSGILLSKTWEVRADDPEQKLERALQHFQDAKFTLREEEWINPHAAPDEIYYENRNVGIVIEVRKLRQEVAAITWLDPKSRSVAKNMQQPCVKFQKAIGLISCKAD
jgi:hypothetical protein